ncbi:transcription factor with AP2 domain(s), putative [Plasmodium relictum]|uniref:Transcription factor with AP2 domain(S), putative n=1 Tax=Plasmodium relictum TaxID=85471 RepID=A0A1J1H9F2_PLARL|nr:transcription factor with AP2 domain(s), putative [Plasmodium relictum]CRH01431.1 transcription factor with AP2 domain(s), putative [Plasmodium relictum]
MINYSDNKHIIENQKENDSNSFKNRNDEKGSDINDSDIYESNDDNTKNKGVWYNARTKCWLACVKGSGRHLRVFSVKKHGYKKAKMLAVECKNAAFYNDSNSNNEYTNKKNNINTDIKNESNSNNTDYVNDLKDFDYKKNDRSNEDKIESEESIDSKNSIDMNYSNSQIIMKNDKSNLNADSEKLNKKRRYNTRRCNYNSSNELTKDNNNNNNNINNNSFHNEYNNIKEENQYISRSDNYSERNEKYKEESNNYQVDNKKKKKKIKDQFNYFIKNDNNHNNNSSCIITDKDFQIDSPEQTNEENFFIKPFVYDYNENTKTKNKYNENEYNVIFTNDYYSDYCYQNKDEYKSNFIDLTREALALILQDLKKNVVPKVPVGIEKRERYANSLRLCLRNAKFTKHFNELEPYLELFSECIKNSKLPSHMDLKDQLFYLDKL